MLSLRQRAPLLSTVAIFAIAVGGLLVAVAAEQLYLRLAPTKSPFTITVGEACERATERSYETFAEARGYADDLATEGQPVVRVFNRSGYPVYQGRPTLGSSPFRVEVLEHNGSTTEHWYVTFDDARGYADDVASEADSPVVRVYNGTGRLVYRGRHYAS